MVDYTTGETTYTPEQVAKIIHRSPSYVRNLLANAELAGINVGAGQQRPRWIVTERGLNEFFARRRNTPQQAKRPAVKKLQPQPYHV